MRVSADSKATLPKVSVVATTAIGETTSRMAKLTALISHNRTKQIVVLLGLYFLYQVYKLYHRRNELQKQVVYYQELTKVLKKRLSGATIYHIKT